LLNQTILKAFTWLSQLCL